MAQETKPNSAEMQTSRQPAAQKLSYGEWLIEQLTLLAEGKGKEITEQRLAINAADLLDVPQEVMADVFPRARKTLKYYPEVCELREMAGCLTPQQQLEAGAMDAWLKVLRQITKHGIDGTGAKPDFPERTWHAIRAVGGLPRIHTVPDDELGFVKREFLEAWKGAKHVETYRQLQASDAPKELQGLVNKFLTGKAMPKA